MKSRSGVYAFVIGIVMALVWIVLTATGPLGMIWKLQSRGVRMD